MYSLQMEIEAYDDYKQDMLDMMADDYQEWVELMEQEEVGNEI